MGEWVKELNLVTEFIQSKYKTTKVSFYGNKEAGLAGLFLSALKRNIENVTLKDAPVSYLFDNRESIEYYSAGINVPWFLNWGDISLVAAMSGKSITFINPLTMSGRNIDVQALKDFKEEFKHVRMITETSGKTEFKL
jgi:hypothetical protein